ncbi:MAG TPA: hypothetical protein VMW53_08010 [archaeon]|nr:hypothetical protein [archaeon]
MKEIFVELERNRVRMVVRHDEDETILKFNLQEAEKLSEDLKQALKDYQQRKHVRID